MNFSISCRQPASYLKRTEEIKVHYKDRDYLFNLIENYPNKRMVVEIPKDEIIDELTWQTFAAHTEKLNGQFYVCLYDYEHIKKCREYHIRYYWGVPLTSLYELNAVKKLGVSFALIAAPLAFKLPEAKDSGLRLRLIPNMGFTDHIARANGIHGAWVRPEDIDIYNQYIDTFEFMSRNLQHERGLFDIYKKGEWNDDLNLLITGLNYHVPNYMIDGSKLANIRIKCGQRCEENRPCHQCESYLTFVNKNTEYQLKKKEQLD